MGIGIAQVFAQNEFNVVLADASIELAKRGLDRFAATLNKLVEKAKIQTSQRDAILSRIQPIGSITDLNSADLVIEAATENIEIKLTLFQSIDRAMKPGALLASNTSSISITKLAAVTQRPELVGGMHFMNPVPLMKLCEIVRGMASSETTITTLIELAQRVGKTTIVSKDAPGFLVNRILIPFLNEACFALQEGVGSAEDLDQGAKLGLNHPMGPLELADLIGLDTCLSIAEVLHREFCDDKYRPAVLLRNLVAAGWLGKKTGRGFYIYDANGRKRD